MKVISEYSSYMLRNDGNPLNCHECGYMHPYFKYVCESTNKSQIEILINRRNKFIDWFMENTKQRSIKNDIILFLSAVINSNEFNIIADNVSKYELSDEKLSIDEIYSLYEYINNALNQEFIRVRTSNLKFGGSDNSVYFRVGSAKFNWFNIIWQFVYDNKDWFSDITISTDPQSKGGKIQYYNHNGNEIYHMSIEKFITLSGNPVIE